MARATPRKFDVNRSQRSDDSAVLRALGNLEVRRGAAGNFDIMLRGTNTKVGAVYGRLMPGYLTRAIMQTCEVQHDRMVRTKGQAKGTWSKRAPPNPTTPHTSTPPAATPTRHPGGTPPIPRG